MPDDTSRPGTTKVSRASPKFGVRMPPETRALLNRKANAAGLSESALIRALIEDAPIVSAAEQTERQQTHAQLARIGNNLNQIAKRMNATGNVYEADVKEVKELMKQVWQSQKSMLSKQPSIKQ